MNLRPATAGVISMTLAFFSCKTIKEFKDTRAVDRVTASKPLLNKVKSSVDSLWPCKTDSGITFHPGKVDSVPYSILVPVFIDTVHRQRIVDSLLSIKTDQKALVEDSYGIGWIEGVNGMNQLKIPTYTPDTVFIVTVDKRPLDLANAVRAESDKQLAAAQAIAAGYRKTRNNLFWLVAALLLVMGMIIFYKVKRLL